MSSKVSCSVPLEEGEVEEQMPLQEYANRLKQELERVRSIVDQVDILELGARIEEVKISLAMYRSLFDVLVTEQTKRLNVTSEQIESKGVEDMVE